MEDLYKKFLVSRHVFCQVCARLAGRKPKNRNETRSVKRSSRQIERKMIEQEMSDEELDPVMPAR